MIGNLQLDVPVGSTDHGRRDVEPVSVRLDDLVTERLSQHHIKNEQVAQLSQRDRAAGGVLSL